MSNGRYTESYGVRRNVYGDTELLVNDYTLTPGVHDALIALLQDIPEPASGNPEFFPGRPPSPTPTGRWAYRPDPENAPDTWRVSDEVAREIFPDVPLNP